MSDAREVAAEDVLRVELRRHEYSDRGCLCGHKWAVFNDYPYKQQFARHVAASQLAALSENGYTICGEQVGWAGVDVLAVDETGDNESSWPVTRRRLKRDDRPVFIELEEPK